MTKGVGVAVCLAVCLAACDDDGVDVSGVVAGVEIVSGSGQAGPPGQELPELIIAQALRADGDPHRTARVGATLVSGEGAVASDGARGSGDGATLGGQPTGTARIRWTLGVAGQEQRLRFFVVNVDDTISVDVTATVTAAVTGAGAGR